MTDTARSTNRPLATAAVLFGMFVSAVEMTIVGTAMPRIAGALGGSDRFAWIISVYLLTNTVAAPLSGKLADLYGRKPIYLSGMALFLVGSALCGAAPTMDLLIAARAVQGLGGGAVATVALTIIGDLYSPVERGRVQGLFSAVWGTAGAIGPLAGGFIVDHIGWRWVFLINLPFGAAAMALLLGSLHERVEKRAVRLDVAGALLLTASITALQFASGGHGAHAGSRSTWIAVIAVALLVCFILVERRAAAPILPISLLSDRLIVTVLSTSLLAGALMFGITNFVPLYVQGVEGASARAAGVVMTPLSVAWPIASVVAGLLIARVDPRVLVRIGMAVVAVGAVLPMFAQTGASTPWFVASGLLFGAGMGMSSTPLLISLQSAVSWESRGIGTAAFSFCRTMGGTLGIVLAGAIQSSRLASRGIESHVIDAMLRPGAPAGEPAARAALEYAVRGVFVSLAVLGLVAFASALAFPAGAVNRGKAGQPASTH